MSLCCEANEEWGQGLGASTSEAIHSEWDPENTATKDEERGLTTVKLQGGYSEFPHPPARWRQPDTVDPAVEPPRPFSPAFDELWIPWLRSAQVTGARWVRKRGTSLWDLRMDASALLRNASVGADAEAALEASTAYA